MDKNTSSQSLLYGAIGLILGIVLAVLVVNNQMYGMMGMMGMGNAGNIMRQGMMSDHETENQTGMNMSMSAMMDDLENKAGDDFDKAFIAQMIVHHQGAIEMANDARKKANHQEIKNLAEAIIAAQQQEIDEMRGWYKSWYGTEVETGQ